MGSVDIDWWSGECEGMRREDSGESIEIVMGELRLKEWCSGRVLRVLEWC